MMNNLRILAIEASDQLRQILTTQLQQVGFEQISFVATAREALDCLCRQPIDLLLTDLRLNDMRGFTFIRRLAGLPQPPAIAVITDYPGMLLDSKCMQARIYGLKIVAQQAKPLRPADIAKIAASVQPALSQQSVTAIDPYHFQRNELLTAIQCGEIRPQDSHLHDRTSDVALHGEWHHSRLGILEASQFMPAIERNGLQDMLHLSILNKIKPQTGHPTTRGVTADCSITSRCQGNRPQPWASQHSTAWAQ